MPQMQTDRQYSYTITAGALMRRTIRRQLQELGLNVAETKTLLRSDFRITGMNLEMYRSVMLWVGLLSAL